MQHRLVWFREDNKPKDKESISLITEIVQDDGLQAVVRATAFDSLGRALATGTKRETKSDFNDYLEKAETGALGRVLAVLGYGTQFAEEFELPEGKLVDAPVATRDSKKSPDTNESDKRAQAIQNAKTKAQEKQAAEAVATSNTAGGSNAAEKTAESNAADNVQPITEGQKKAIGNVSKMVAKKNPSFSEDEFLQGFLTRFGKGSIEEISDEQAKEVIGALNAEFKKK
ncbi:hypothetical protein D3C71_980000 [compost metagenome]